MGWWITLGILFLLAILPLGAGIVYDESGFQAKLIAGPVHLTIVPFPKWLKKGGKKPQKETPPASEPKPEEPKKEPPKEEKPKEETPKPQKGGSWTDFLPLVKLGLDFLGDFRRKLRLNHLELKLILGGGDPCDLAVNYGRAWAAAANLLNALERAFVIQKRNIEVECDFTSDDTTVIARLDITITLGRLLSLITVYAIRGLKEFLKLRKKRKGGAAK